jgi:predicted esterase
VELPFIHRFESGDGADLPTLLLLHGTGGDESDLFGIGRSIAPRANLLSPRGKVSENGVARFFRRFAEGIFDEDDIRLRSRELAEFVAAAAKEYKFDAAKVVAFGFSNGANIATSMLILHPEVLAGAILLRPMVPLVPNFRPKLDGKPILIQAGSKDPMGSAAEIQRLVEMLGRFGADLTIKQHHTGHGLTHDDFSEAQKWLSEYFPKTQGAAT